MHQPASQQERGWAEKFRDAFRGLKLGVHGQSSFFVHFFMGAMVIAAAVAMKVDSLTEWCLLILCITVVLTAEMFNSAIETLARAITDQHDPILGTALDIGSGAVLLASLGAAVVGLILFVNRLALLMAWW